VKARRVLIAFDVDSEESDDDVKEKIRALLDHGTVGESFAAVDLDVSNYDVFGVGEASEDPRVAVFGAVKLVLAAADDFGGPVGVDYVGLMLDVAAHAGERARGYVASPGIMAVGGDGDEDGEITGMDEG